MTNLVINFYTIQNLCASLRTNAIFYQTFTQHSKADPYAEEWNEMVVKYRKTGHTAGLHENIRKWVPELEAHPDIDDKLEDSGKFSSLEATYEAKFLPPLVREGSNSKKEKVKKKPRGKGGKRK